MAYKNPVCKGDWIVGTACGKCERCIESAPEAIARLRQHWRDAREETRRVRELLQQASDERQLWYDETERLKQELIKKERTTKSKAGFDVGYGRIEEGDDCILVAEGNMPSGPARLLSFSYFGDAQVELHKIITTHWRFLRPLHTTQSISSEDKTESKLHEICPKTEKPCTAGCAGPHYGMKVTGYCYEKDRARDHAKSSHRR